MSDKNQEESILNEEALLKDDASTENADEKLLSDDESLLSEEPAAETPAPELTDNMADPDATGSENELLNETPPTENPIEETNPDDLLNTDQTVDTMSAAPFDKTLGDINSTLSNLEKKIETEQGQLKKLDQLADIKSELVKINQNKSLGSSGHNLPEVTELMQRIDIIEKRLNDMETSNKSKFADVDNVITRFNALEKELDVEYDDDEQSSSGSSFMKLFDNKDKKEDDNQPEDFADERVKELNEKENVKKQQNQNAKILLLVLLLLILGFWALDFFGIVELHLLKYFTI